MVIGGTMKLPDKVDLSEGFDIPIFDQGDLGSSTACATAGLMMYHQARQAKERAQMKTISVTEYMMLSTNSWETTRECYRFLEEPQPFHDDGRFDLIVKDAGITDAEAIEEARGYFEDTHSILSLFRSHVGGARIINLTIPGAVMAELRDFEAVFAMPAWGQQKYDFYVTVDVGSICNSLPEVVRRTRIELMPMENTSSFGGRFPAAVDADTLPAEHRNRLVYASEIGSPWLKDPETGILYAGKYFDPSKDTSLGFPAWNTAPRGWTVKPKTPHKQISVPLWEYGHFDNRCILWAAEKAGICTLGQMIAVHLVGISHPNNVATLTFEAKPFNDHWEFESDPDITKEWQLIEG